MVPLLPACIDTVFDDAGLLRAAITLVSGDLGPAQEHLAATRAQPYRRELAVDVLGAAGNVVLPALPDAQEGRPDDVNLLLLLGSAQSVAGWQERGGRSCATLHRAAELDPDDVASWAALKSVALGAPDRPGEPAEVDAASDRLLAGVDGQPYSLWAHQIFAMFYFQGEMNDRLALHLTRSGKRAARWPWACLGDPDKRFAGAHQQAARA